VHFSRSLPSNSWWQTMVGCQVLSRPSAAEGGGRRSAFTGPATQPYSATEVDGWQRLSWVSQNRAAVHEANHGAPLKPYLEKIITADFDIREMAREATVSFARHVADVGDDVVARDVASKFGLVYAGGLLGIRFGIVPWQQDELLDAIAKCYRGARNQLPDEGEALRRGLAILRSFLGGLGRRKKLRENASTDWGKIEGYRWRSSDRDRYVIKREVFNSLFATTAQKNLLLNHLIENGQITTAVAKGGGVSTARKPKKQFIWPDGERRRSYQITFPRG
jgi:hypothetical protein